MAILDWPAKSTSDEGVEHPALYHMIDVGTVAECLVERMNIPPCRRAFYALAAALHDLGKISVSFRGMLRDGTAQTKGRHWEVTEAWLRRFDVDLGVIADDRFDRLDFYAAIAGHHGLPPVQENFEPMIAAAGQEAEGDARNALAEIFKIWPDARYDLPWQETPAQTWWLPGLIAVADWVASNPDFFPPVAEAMDLAKYLDRARALAREAVHLAGLDVPLVSSAPLMPQGWTLRPMQATAQTIDLPDGPVLAVIEDETGSGKTEAALILAQRMMQAGLGEGLFFALPTMATANAMFDRAADLAGRLFDTAPSLALALGRAEMSARFRDLIKATRGKTMPACTEWLADNRRRALLANVGVGTIDQALLSALPVRHAMLRHFALSGAFPAHAGINRGRCKPRLTARSDRAPDTGASHTGFRLAYDLQ